MKSPFPGMDPYLEQYWLDVHHGLVTYARDQLQPRLPADLRARMQERVFVEADDGRGRVLYPDVHVVERPKSQRSPTGPEQAVELAEPLVIRVGSESLTQGYIEIVELGSGDRVVTVIEFLSPSNKVEGEGQNLYLSKQREVRAARVNLVEIDLTRAGKRVLALPPSRIPPSHRTLYQICVWRALRPLSFEVYRVPLRERLPAIKVPLRETDADVPLDLQALIEQCYTNGRYGDLDYRADPDPALDADDTAWANEMLLAQGRR
jgi:hypothetical protein